jgi:hypothetical protein
MSLFSSAFDAPLAGPSTPFSTPVNPRKAAPKDQPHRNQPNDKKRKRPSGQATTPYSRPNTSSKPSRSAPPRTPRSDHKDAKVQSVKASLDKIMVVVQGAPVLGVGKVGSEPMGSLGKKKKNPKKSMPTVQAEPTRRHSESGKGRSKHADDDETFGSSRTSYSRDKGNASANANANSHERPAPAELSLPSAPPADKGKNIAGLTDMQKKMQSKLDGARFRWINEQLYSTQSSEALEMMRRDPKIFADVSSLPRHSIRRCIANETVPLVSSFAHRVMALPPPTAPRLTPGAFTQGHSDC